MTPPSQHIGGHSEDEVRDVVSRVLDGILAGGVPDVDEPDPRPRAGADAPAAGDGVVAIGADHGGYSLKEKIAFRLRESGVQVLDCGTDGPDSVDYPDFAHAVARAVADGSAEWGIVVDGAGIGSAMAANNSSRFNLLNAIKGPALQITFMKWFHPFPQQVFRQILQE